MRLLLLSNSTVWGGKPLEHVVNELPDFVSSSGPVAVLAFGRKNFEEQLAAVRPVFARVGADVINVGSHASPRQAIKDAASLYVAGGNAFRVLKALYDLDLLEPLKRRILEGVPYVGASAGATMACPSIRTCNSMPIVEPPSFQAMGLVSFQINCHFVAGPPTPTHMGETREQRIAEFHEERSEPVLAMREGSWIRRDADQIALQGTSGACLFRQGQPAMELSQGYDLTEIHHTTWRNPNAAP